MKGRTALTYGLILTTLGLGGISTVKHMTKPKEQEVTKRRITAEDFEKIGVNTIDITQEDERLNEDISKILEQDKAYVFVTYGEGYGAESNFYVLAQKYFNNAEFYYINIEMVGKWEDIWARLGPIGPSFAVPAAIGFEYGKKVKGLGKSEDPEDWLNNSQVPLEERVTFPKYMCPAFKKGQG